MEEKQKTAVEEKQTGKKGKQPKEPPTPAQVEMQVKQLKKELKQAADTITELAEAHNSAVGQIEGLLLVVRRFERAHDEIAAWAEGAWGWASRTRPCLAAAREIMEIARASGVCATRELQDTAVALLRETRWMELPDMNMQPHLVVALTKVPKRVVVEKRTIREEEDKEEDAEEAATESNEPAAPGPAAPS